MKHLEEFNLINESDSQTYGKLQFIREQIRDITKTIRIIDWTKTTDVERNDIISSLKTQSDLINQTYADNLRKKR